MYNFGASVECMEQRRVVSSYLDVDTTKYQCCILNPKPLERITGYIMQDAVSDRDFKRIPYRSLNFMDYSISSYYSILNSPKKPEQIRQEKNLASVPFDLGSYRTGGNEEENKRAMQAK